MVPRNYMIYLDDLMVFGTDDESLAFAKYNALLQKEPFLPFEMRITPMLVRKGSIR